MEIKWQYFPRFAATPEHLKETVVAFENAAHEIATPKHQLSSNEVLERVRGLKDVTIVDVVKNDRLEAITSKSKIHDFSLFKVKFVTNKDPLERVEELKDEMLRSDVAKDKYRIVGIVYVKPQIATVKINK